MPPRPSSSMISYSAARASRTRSVSWSAPVAMAWTGVVAMRSRPQDGQNLDLPVISLPQREQNMRASYPSDPRSQAETRGVPRYPLRTARAKEHLRVDARGWGMARTMQPRVDRRQLPLLGDLSPDHRTTGDLRGPVSHDRLQS